MILCNFISLRAFTVYMETHCGLKFHFGQIDWSEICTEVSFTTPEVMWMLIMKLSHTKVKFYPEVKSQTSLSSLWVSCKPALIFWSPFCLRFSMSWFLGLGISMLWLFGLGISMSWFFGLGISMLWYVCLCSLVFVFIMKTEKITQNYFNYIVEEYFSYPNLCNTYHHNVCISRLE